MSKESINSNIFKKEIVKDIVLCFEKGKKSQLRFSDIKKGLKGLPDKKYFDTQIVRALSKMVSLGVFEKKEESKRWVSYKLTGKYMIEIRQSQLSQLIDSYPPEEVMDFSKTVLLGLPNEVYRLPIYEGQSRYFHDLYIEPEDVFSNDSRIGPGLKKRMKEIANEYIGDNYKNKTKDELLELVEEFMLSNMIQNLSFIPISPEEACERIVQKLTKGRDKYRLLSIQHEYNSQLPHVIDSGFRQYLHDHQEYFTQNLNLLFEHFFKTGANSREFIYKDFENKDDFEYTLHLFCRAKNTNFQTDIVPPTPESVFRVGIEILKFLSTIVRKVNKQTNYTLISPITIVSTSFRAVFADKEFWENEKKIRNILNQQKYV